MCCSLKGAKISNSKLLKYQIHTLNGILCGKVLVLLKEKKHITQNETEVHFIYLFHLQSKLWREYGLCYFASRGREYPFGYSRPACWDTQTRETHLAVRLKFVAKSRFHLLVPRWYFVVAHYIGCEESWGLTCDEISGCFEIDVEMYEKQVLPAEKKKQPGHGAVINSLTAVCSGYFHLTAGYLESVQCFVWRHLNQSYFSVPYGILGKVLFSRLAVRKTRPEFL